MILDVSASQFREIFQNESFHLPIRWDGEDFVVTLESLYTEYIDRILQVISKETVKDIRRDCELIIKAVNHYLNGYPNKAYRSMEVLMTRMILPPVGKYFLTAIDEFKYANLTDSILCICSELRGSR